VRPTLRDSGRANFHFLSGVNTDANSLGESMNTVDRRRARDIERNAALFAVNLKEAR